MSSTDDENSDEPAVRLNRMHGLSWDTSKGTFRLRVTLDVGKKVVGKRLQFLLPTSDTHTAIVMRDSIIRGYQKLGLKVTTRFITRKPEPPKQMLSLPAPVEPKDRTPLDWGPLRGRE